jgi:DNA primase
MTSSGITTEIKSKLPVLDIVGETVALKRAGSAYKGLCPFHAEKTPSFIVSPDRETWHCFGCGEGGDIFTFLMRRDGLDFREALSRLAEKAGVELSERTAREDRRNRRLREALEAAIAWYREVLLQAHQAERARGYLEERGFSAETLERFGIGYAPNTWEALTRRLIGRGFTNDELIGAGLASPSNRGGVIDKFRGRIIIPIRDASGRATGLGGRIMPDAEGPKYLNSPAGPIFDKSRTLFAIDLAKQAIRREKLAVIVEGYTDVMAAHQAGFGNVVASLGTALTQGQVALANRYADEVALAYDVDVAGEAATQRGLLEELGPVVSKVRVIRIPAGKDPDELIRTDPDGWRTAVGEREELLPYFMRRAAEEFDMRQPHGRSAYTRHMLDLLGRIPDRVERDSYVPQLAKLADIDERVLREELVRGPRPIPIRPQPVQEAADERGSLTPLEKQLLVLLLSYPELLKELPAEAPMPLRDAAGVALVTAWRAHVASMNGSAASGSSLEAFVAGLDPGSAELARDLLARISSRRDERLEPEVARNVLQSVLLRLRIMRLDEDLRDGRLLLEEAERDGDKARLAAIEQRLIQLGRDKAEATRTMHEPPVAAGARRT